MRRSAIRLTGLAAAVVATLSLTVSGLGAQQLDPPPPPADSGTTVTVVPGAQYEAGALRRFFIGQNRRDLWGRELRVPLLDLDRFGGGLTPEDQGGNQSKTLHMVTPEGRTYIFRSVDKYMGQVLPEDLEGTWIADIAQDHVSIFHPGGSFVVPRFHEALGHLAIPPVYRVMPDDPRLGEYRETFAGMLGTVVERPDEGPHGEVLFAGSHRIVATDELYDKLEDHPRNQVAAREFLEARLVDILVGDADRGPDQWRWARVPAQDGFRWRPVVRDRDWAFMTAEGALPWLVRQFYPKLVRFQDDLPGVNNMTWADVGMGRRLLAGLDAAAWDSAISRVVATLDDPVIDEAVDRLPPEHKPGHADALAARLRARRAGLRALAMAWYARLSTDVDVRATDLPDRAEIVRSDDGSVAVTLYGPAEVMVPVVPGGDDDDEDAAERSADPYYDRDRDPGFGDEVDGWAPYFHRVFRPGETGEVRVYLHGDDDVAVVRGAGAPSIAIRVIGGGGEDALYDATPDGRAVHLYDTGDETLFAPARRTAVSTRDFDAPEGSENFVMHKIGYDRHRDWGAERSWFGLTADYREGAGIILGGGPSWTDYRFRSIPHGFKLRLHGLVSTATGGVGADAVADLRVPASPVYLRLHARATRFDAFRFYGYGNATPLLDEETALVMRDHALTELLLGAETERWSLAAGPVVRYGVPDVPVGNPAALADLPGTGEILEAGAMVRGSLDRVDGGLPTRGARLAFGATGFPAAGDGAGPHARVEAEARGYLPVPLPGLPDPVLAVRLGGQRAVGAYPIHGSAALGGRTTLRGYRWQRFRGDAAAWGGVDLRLPLFRANLGLVKGRLGVIGLGDAGRVWLDGSSEGDWHTGYGAGLSFETLTTGLYVLWARGEEDRLYAGLGVPF